MQRHTVCEDDQLQLVPATTDLAGEIADLYLLLVPMLVTGAPYLAFRPVAEIHSA